MERPEAAYLRAKTLDVLAGTAVTLLVAVPFAVQAWSLPEVRAWRERLAQCEGCLARRARLLRFVSFLRAYDRAERDVVREARWHLRRAPTEPEVSDGERGE